MIYLALPLSILAFAFVLHGFPDIRIGTRDTFKHYYGDSSEEEDEK